MLVTDGPGDGGVDLRLWDDRDTLTIVQAKCKSARYKVSETEMMAFDGALAREERRERGVRAIFVTSTGFVEGARERARPHGARLLLMGEPELRAALAEHDVSRALAADPDVLSLLRANRLSFAPPPDATPPPPLPPPPDAAATAVLAAATPPPPPPPPPARQPSDASPARSGGTPGRQREAWTPEEDDALLRACPPLRSRRQAPVHLEAIARRRRLPYPHRSLVPTTPLRARRRQAPVGQDPRRGADLRSRSAW